MTRIFALAAAAMLTVSTTTAPAQAGPITTLGECYTAVINWCENTFPDHADECGQSSGLDDCDDEFGNASAGLGINRAGPAVPARTFASLVNSTRRAQTTTMVRVSR